MINYSTWDASDGNYMVINGVRYPVINSGVSGPPDHTDRLAWKIVTEGHEAEEQPAAPAEATATNARARERCQKCRKPFSTQDSSLQHADMPFCKECADRCHDTEIADHWCAVDQWRMDQHTAPADATACTSNCDGSDMCTGDQLPDADADPEIQRKRIVSIGSPFPGFPSKAELADRIFGPGTAESLGTAARYIERPSGPPVRVDGPGCTPATVSVPCLGEECTGCSDPQCWTARADGGDA